MHLTVSVMQKWSWVDLLEVVLSDMLEAVAVAESETTTMLRIGLPRGFLDYMEMIHEENEGGTFRKDSTRSPTELKTTTTQREKRMGRHVRRNERNNYKKNSAPRRRKRRCGCSNMPPP